MIPPVKPVDPHHVAAVLADFRALLTDDVTYDGWETQTAAKNAFYIRGYTWFYSNVLTKIPMNITQCSTVIPRAKEIIKARTEWSNEYFDWNLPLAANQVHSSVSTKRKPLLFSKAVEVTVVFEAFAERVAGLTPTDIYSYIRIEPAVSYVNDFSITTIDMMKSRDPGVFTKLRKATGQETVGVFYDMANRKTVTHKLARKVADFINTNYPDISIGDVGFTLNNRYIFSPSENEKLD